MALALRPCSLVFAPAAGSSRWCSLGVTARLYVRARPLRNVRLVALMPPLPTGLSAPDAQDDFRRARRRQAVSRLARFLTRERGDVDVILPFDEVVAALGRTGERDLGLHALPLDSIVGTVDRRSGFDREFRPTTWRVGPRWERIAAAMRGGR